MFGNMQETQAATVSQRQRPNGAHAKQNYVFTHCARTDQCPAVNCNCLPTKNLGVLKNSLKRVRAFQIELKFGSVGFYGEGKTGVTGGKANVINCRSCPHTELQSLWAALQIESSC